MAPQRDTQHRALALRTSPTISSGITKPKAHAIPKPSRGAVALYALLDAVMGASDLPSSGKDIKRKSGADDDVIRGAKRRRASDDDEPKVKHKHLPPRHRHDSRPYPSHMYAPAPLPAVPAALLAQPFGHVVDAYPQLACTIDRHQRSVRADIFGFWPYQSRRTSSSSKSPPSPSPIQSEEVPALHPRVRAQTFDQALQRAPLLSRLIERYQTDLGREYFGFWATDPRDADPTIGKREVECMAPPFKPAAPEHVEWARSRTGKPYSRPLSTRTRASRW
ncbi:Uu.00g021500.m01.CDS01 [Anthostomella pinea]|uniref:Uu.00g021500.m01.CDS01 n=1 Tax=Anthostomella pinea TaxID=933095 RepID=A0AAI8YQZ2_9PEZI|nr:Uu.00g021500.m01.CDS01 [Anthostomella pinea]